MKNEWINGAKKFCLHLPFTIHRLQLTIMFCPKCGTQNPDNGKFCRACGTDLKNVSAALSGKLEEQNDLKLLPDFWMMTPRQRREQLHLRDKKGKPVHWEGAITKLFTGIAFLAVTIALSFSQMGRGWWFWMLIPAFSCLGAGVAQIIQLRKAEKGNFLAAPDEAENNFLPNRSNHALPPPNQTDYIRIENLVNSGSKREAIKIHREVFGSSLKEAKKAIERIEREKTVNPPPPNPPSDYIAPPRGSIYDTGELNTPPSVTEDTTRHLEINAEGETMTLPPKK